MYLAGHKFRVEELAARSDGPAAAGAVAHRAGGRCAWSLALLVGLGACADGEIRRIPLTESPGFGTGNPARAARESDMNRKWQDRPLAELVAAYGRPGLVMTIPGGGMAPGYAVVYGHDPASGCIDAFAVVSGQSPVVRMYHCR